MKKFEQLSTSPQEEQKDFRETQMPTKKKLRLFSREHSSTIRQQVAAEIVDERKKYFERKQKLDGEIQKLTLEAQEKGREISEVIRELESIENIIEARKRSSIIRLLNHFSIKKLQREIAEKASHQKKVVERRKEIQDALRLLQQQKEDRRTLEEAKAVLHNFYRGQQEQWEEYEENKKIRSLANITKAYNTVFVHGTHPIRGTPNNLLGAEDANWITKLKIVLALEPTLSASTIREGDNYRNMWARIGVILNSGYVIEAYPEDVMTIKKGLKKREVQIPRRLYNPDDNLDMRWMIHKAITTKKHYNEFIIENPSVAGFYICLDKDYFTAPVDNIPPVEKIASVVSELGMPLYAIQNGSVFDAEYNPATKELVLKGGVSPQDILQRDFRHPEIQKQRLAAELFVDSPLEVEPSQNAKAA